MESDLRRVRYINFYTGISVNYHSNAFTLASTSLSLKSLLHDPNPNSPANNEAAQLFRENKREYEKRVQQIVQESWLGDSDEETEGAK
jgi:ubiquitin-conjugating enzyme E2 A